MGCNQGTPALRRLLLPKRAAAAFGFDALLLKRQDEFLPVPADGSGRVDPDLPGKGDGAFLRLGDPFGEGLDQVPGELPLVGIGGLFQAIHALTKLVQLHEGRLGVESHHSAAPLSVTSISTSRWERYS